MLPKVAEHEVARCSSEGRELRVFAPSSEDFRRARAPSLNIRHARRREAEAEKEVTLHSEDDDDCYSENRKKPLQALRLSSAENSRTNSLRTRSHTVGSKMLQ